MPQIACDIPTCTQLISTHFTSLIGTETLLPVFMEWALSAELCWLGPSLQQEALSVVTVQIHFTESAASFQTSLCQFCLVLNSNEIQMQRGKLDFYKNETKCSRMANPNIHQSQMTPGCPLRLREEAGEVKTSFIRKLRC